MRHTAIRTLFALSLSLVVAGIPTPSVAQPTSWPLPKSDSDGHTQPATTRTSSTAVSESAWRNYDRAQWTLSDAEWMRYEEIMRGPRGAWSPNLDPITALGVEARSTEERTRYAEMLVMQEEARTRKELDFTRAYSDAWKKLYPNAPLFDKTRFSDYNPSAPEEKPFSPGDRIAFFMPLSCTSCRDIINQVMGHVRGLMYPGIDVYVLAANGEDIQKWAKSTKLPLDLIQNGTMTLNLDDGLLARLQKTKTPNAPVAYRRRGEQFVEIEMIALAKDELYPVRGQGLLGASNGSSPFGSSLAPQSEASSSSMFGNVMSSISTYFAPPKDGAQQP